jgi:hypothetical protein
VAYSKMVHALPSGVGIAALSSLARAMSDGASRLSTVGGCCICTVARTGRRRWKHWPMVAEYRASSPATGRVVHFQFTGHSHRTGLGTLSR